MNNGLSRRRTRSEIEGILAEYNGSGETQRDFAQRHGIGVSTLSLWLRRERESGAAGAGNWGRAKLVEVCLAGAEASRREPGIDFEIEFAGGERLRVRRGFLAEELRVIVAALSGAQAR